MANADTYRTVMITGAPVTKEYTSAALKTVGEICQLNSSGQLAASNVASTVYPGGELVVTEAPERGEGIYSSGTTVNTYAITEQVPTIATARGDEVLVRLEINQTITRAGLLEVNSSGHVIAHAGTNLPWGRAMEARFTGGTATALIHVMKL